MAVALLLVVIVVAAGLDSFATNGRVYAGVRIGDVDVGGMTRTEAIDAINSAYASPVADSSATIYSSEEVRDELESGRLDATATLEEQSVEQARNAGQAWTPTAASLEASVPTDALVDEALAVGRSDGGVIGRAISALFGHPIDVAVELNPTSLEALAESIDTSIGTKRVDYGIDVSGGTAKVTQGSDGVMVDRAWLSDQLSRAFLSTDPAERSFVAQAEPAPVRIDEAAAQEAADKVNAAIAQGADFTYGSQSWHVDSAGLAAWVTAEPVAFDEAGARLDPQPGPTDSAPSWRLVPSISSDAAAPALLNAAKSATDDTPLTVQFEREGDEIYVLANSDGEIPLISDAVSTLNTELFEGNAPADAPAIDIASAQTPEKMTFDEAVDYGVVTAFSSFTTEYTTGAGTEERNNNIHLAADLLDGSIVKANGGIWSFNDTAGECNEGKGFQAAGAIVAGEYTDSIGGGICQVATTVFNAVYESGLSIVLRFNHTLYISSYPAGRDAAVSWPDVDLQWRNDERSDVLLRMSYTDGTVTATLYGVDPEYTVLSEVGQWEEGEKHSTRYVEDSSLAEGSSYVQTAGSDGSKITVVRTVTDSSGALVREDTFVSEYAPKNEVVVVGPGYTPPDQTVSDSE